LYFFLFFFKLFDFFKLDFFNLFFIIFLRRSAARVLRGRFVERTARGEHCVTQRLMIFSLKYFPLSKKKRKIILKKTLKIKSKVACCVASSFFCPALRV